MKVRKIGEIELEALQPFDFHLTASIYSFPWVYNRRFLFLQVSSNPVIIARVSETSTGVSAEIFSSENVDEDEVAKKIEFMLGLREDLTDFYKIVENDALLREVPRSLRGARLRSLSLWASLLTAVCQQNASFKQGWTMLYNIYVKLGERIKIDNNVFICTPQPDKMLENKGILAECRVGYRAETMLSLAQAFKEGFSEEVAELKGEELEKALRELRGVGSYTARLALVLSKRFYELPPVDRWTARLASEAYNLSSATLASVDKFLREKWGKWSGLGVFFLTVVLDAEPLRNALTRLRKGELAPRRDAQKLTPLNMWKLMSTV